MNQFIQRIANYVANEILIKGLANSKTFQRFAVRTDSHIRNSKESFNSQLDEMHRQATTSAFSSASSSEGASAASSGASKGYHTSGPPVPPARGVAGFFQAMGREIKKDLGIGK